MADMESKEPTPEALQRKLYFLLEQLQDMARELPPKYQMRVPIELLSGLANCLLNDTVFEIVKGLMEIQHVTEKHLFQQRLQIINKHTMEIQDMINNTLNPEQQELQKNILLRRHKEELKQTDMKLVLQLDQKEPPKRKKLSGAQFRNKKREKDRERKMAGSMVKFLNMPENKDQEISEKATTSGTSSASELVKESEEKKIGLQP